MQFSISAVFFSLALASLGLAAPAANPSAAEVVQRAPNPAGQPFEHWDGKITLIEEIGEDVTVPGISKRTLGLIYICPSFDWQADKGIGCSYVQWSYHNQCVRLSDQYYRYTLSSVAPDPGTFCVLYTSTDCSTGGSDSFSYPGLSRLEGSRWRTWNDNTGSIRCWW